MVIVNVIEEHKNDVLTLVAKALMAHGCWLFGGIFWEDAVLML